MMHLSNHLFRKEVLFCTGAPHFLQKKLLGDNSAPHLLQ